MVAVLVAIVLALGVLVGIAIVLEPRRKVSRETGEAIGAPNLEHPPPTIGAYSAASSGAGGSSDAPPAEGPIQPVD